MSARFLRAWKWDQWHVFLLVCLVLGGGLRLVGLTRGDDGAAFYTFHPDEAMVVQTALAPLDLTDPPITTYGMLPSYVLRGVVELSALVLGWEEVGGESAEARRRVYYTARLLAVLYSMGVLVLVWLLGRRYFDPGVAVLALLCVTFSVGAIQQAHFYIVDGLFILLSTGCLWASLRALEGRAGRWYVATGVLIGLTGAVRLNGLSLGLILLVGYVWTGGIDWRAKVARLRQGHLWLAAGVSLLVLLAVQPFLLTAPERMWQVNSSQDFAFSLQVVRGEMLQPWLLVDLHTTPFVHHWTHLWPLIVGWPLTLFFLAALVYALRRVSLAQGLLLLWCGLYFLMVGGLVAKSVRYVLPMLPFLALFAGQLGVALWRLQVPWARVLGRAVVVGVWVHFALYGCAFARLYSSEDSRIQASRWLDAKLPPNTTIAAERGGFSMLPVLSNERYNLRFMEINTLFGVRGYGTCTTTGRYLQQRLEPAEYIALSPANRQVQFAAVPELYPAVASFYQHLMAGKLGFTQVQRFKNSPQLLGINFEVEGAEPSFLGYDHPTVLIFKKNDRFALDWQKWRADIERDPLCVDGDLRRIAVLLQRGDLEQALVWLGGVQERYPDLLFVALLEAYVHKLRGDVEGEQRSIGRYMMGFSDGSRRANLLPFVVALSAADLGFADVGLSALQAGLSLSFSENFKYKMAESYLYVGNFFLDLDDQDSAAAAFRMATEVLPLPKGYEALGNVAHYQGHIGQALDYWEQALELDPYRIDLGEKVGQVAYEYGFYSRALPYLEGTLRLDDSRTEVKHQLAETKRRLAEGL